MSAPAGDFALQEDAAGPILALSGDWTVWTAPALAARLEGRGAELIRAVGLDVSALGQMDLAGAYLVERIWRDRGGAPPAIARGAHPAFARLIQTAVAADVSQAPPGFRQADLHALLTRIGRGMEAFWREAVGNFDFLGRTLVTLARIARRPARLRWAPTVHVMESAGLNAAPIIILLAFFIGVVVAYLGASILGDFGASIFTIELVAFSMLREFGVVITAVLLAGRTDSAFTAEIGSMKMRQEIDALKVMGVDPMEALVAPRVIALTLMAPALTFLAMIAGLIGGMLVCWLSLGVSPLLFFSRMQEAIPEQHFWVGISKAPLFGFVLAVVGCRHGLETESDVASLGKRTTASVVQGIFTVIVLDALLALWFLEMNW